MKITFLFLLIGVSMAFSKTYSQSTLLSLNLKGESIKEVLNTIEEKSEYVFFFSDEVNHEMDRKVNVQVKNTPLDQILNEILDAKSLSYKIVDRQVTIAKNVTTKNIQFSENQQQPEIRVTGIVRDIKGEVLPGVSVMVKGTTAGTVTDANGNYSIKIPSENATLLFSYIGFVAQQVEVKGKKAIDVSLSEDEKKLDEIVVTALGIKREKKALGYAVQELKGDVLTEARDPNMLNSLAGQIAGVQISNVSTGGIGGSPNVIIRGQTSLTNNQPLFVIDGIPVNNLKSTADHVDFGNGAADINPDDVASISVLKGPTASALYGSRAANGVIVITTKNGHASKGLGVTYNSNVTVQPWLLKTPNYQYRYGAGENFEYEYVDGAGGGKYDASGYCWGPLLNQLDPTTASGYVEIAQFASPIDPKTGKRIPIPWVAHKNFLEDFFVTGTAFTNNVSVAGGNDKGTFRLSYTNLNQKGIVPNTDLLRNTFAFNAGYNLLKNLRVDANVNYVINQSDNMPQIYYWDKPIMYTFMWWGMNEDIRAQRDYWKPGREGVEQRTYNMWLDNPYFTLYENTQGQLKNRLFGNISLNYQIIPGLTFIARTGTDWYNDNIQIKRAYSSQNYKNGMYSVRNTIFQERNSDFLLTWDKEATEKIQYKISAGGNRMSRMMRYTSTTAPELSIPGLYNLGNSKAAPVATEENTNKAVNSLYAMGQIAYNRMLYLDVTARNDWSSTLPLNGNSFFYPSVSLSGIISEMIKLPSSIPFAKVRASWAQVGNDTDPYQLQQVYNYGTKWGNTFTAYEAGKLYNQNLKPEKINSAEVGLDFKILHNRLGFDVAYYNTIATNQILSMEIAPTSGYTSRNINAGKIESRGWEVVFNAIPVQTKDFEWALDINWSTNRAYVRELAEGITTYDMGWPAQARVGQRMGDVYGWGFKHAPDGQFIYKNGLPVWEDEIKRYGNFFPDWMAGMKNMFSYHGFALSALLDYRKGGRIYSGTMAKGMEAGVLAESAIGNQREEGVIGDGVIEEYDSNGNVTYRPNDVRVSLRDWIGRYHNRDAFETNSFDASYIKLREVSLSYTIPHIKLNSTYSLHNVSLALVGRNLWMWAKAPHIDPETGSNGYEDVQIPTPKSVGVNLSVSF